MDPLYNEVREPRDTRSVADLLSELTQETRLLVQQELHLAKAELSKKVQQVERGAVSLTVGGLLAYAGFLALLASAIFGLAKVVDPWLAALIVGGVVMIIGIGFVAAGRESFKAKNLTLPRTTATLQEDKQWIKAHTTR